MTTVPEPLSPTPLDEFNSRASLDVALEYAARGWPIFTLTSSKVPVRNCHDCGDADWTHDRETCSCLLCHGFYAATTDPARITEMLQRVPGGLLALRTGSASGIVAIDAESSRDEDDEPTGLEVLDEWESWTQGTFALPATLRAKTSSGGVHLLYAIPPGVRVKSHTRVLPSVDLKAEGGYIGLPTPGSGRFWLGAGDPANAPTELLEWMMSSRGHTKRGGAGSREGRPAGYVYEEAIRDGAKSGTRDEFFNDLLFRLRKRGVTQDEATRHARHHWERCEQPPAAQWFMPWENVEYKIHHVWRTVAPPEPVHSWRPNGTAVNPLASSNQEDEEVSSQVSPGDGGSGGGSGPATVNEPEPEWPLDEHDTDTGNGHRFARLLSGRVRYAVDEGQWYVWDGSRLARDSRGLAHEYTKLIIADIRQQALVADATGDGDERDRWVAHARRTESARARKSMLESARTDPRIALVSADLDANPWLLTLENGTLDLRTGNVRESLVSDLGTRRAAVKWDPEARCDLWRSHVKLVTQGDVELAMWLRRACGYSLTGLTTEQKFLFLHGDGQNGKNVFVETLLGVMGDYGQQASESLLSGDASQHPTVLADLRGCRLVMADETNKSKMNEARLKSLTGSEKIRGRWMRGDFFEFPNTVKLWVLGNTKPYIADTSQGIWRRMRLVPFSAEIPDEKKILDFARLLVSERSGILNWCLAGLADWRENGGLGESQVINEAVSEYRSEEDAIGRWLDECCTIGAEAANAAEPMSDLYASYRMWCARVGEEILNSKWLGRELTRKHITVKVVKRDGVTTRVRIGVKLKRSV